MGPDQRAWPKGLVKIFSTFPENAQKCCFLLAACPNFVQVLALALPSIKTTIIRRETASGDSQNKTFRVHMRRSRPVCIMMSFLSPPARPLSVDPAQSKSQSCATHHSSRKHVRMSLLKSLTPTRHWPPECSSNFVLLSQGALSLLPGYHII